jgi:hypothetical protein
MITHKLKKKVQMKRQVRKGRESKGAMDTHILERIAGMSQGRKKVGEGKTFTS